MSRARTLRVLKANIYAFLPHPLDLGRQLFSQRAGFLSKFRHRGQGVHHQGVSRLMSVWHVI